MSGALFKREIQSDRPATLVPILCDGLTDPREWLAAKAREHGLKWLLATADDGIIWGVVENGALRISHDAAQGNGEAEKVCAALRKETLQQARLFAQGAELVLWRDGRNVWQARLIKDANDTALEQATWVHHFDEPQLLWGTHGRHLKHDFTLLRDGDQGLRHAVPMTLPLGDGGKTEPPRLLVRHYLNKEGFARVVASRLVDLKTEGEDT